MVIGNFSKIVVLGVLRRMEVKEVIENSLEE